MIRGEGIGPGFMGSEFRVEGVCSIQSVRGGCASLGVGAHPLIARFASACNPAPTTPTILN